MEKSITNGKNSNIIKNKNSQNSLPLRKPFCISRPFCLHRLDLHCLQQIFDPPPSRHPPVPAASAAANSDSAAAKFAELARDSSVKAHARSVSAAASSAVAALAKDFSAKATSLSLLSVPSVSVASSYFASDSAGSNPVGSTSTNRIPADVVKRTAVTMVFMWFEDGTKTNL